MKFVRTYKSGGDNDVRQKTWAEFQCSECGEKHDIDITRNASFDFAKERKCPACGCVSHADRIFNLKAEVEKLAVTKSKLEVQIASLCEEIESLESKK
jgi:predicted RNA-binding Zn-ribbon protein involved in translation (DUF1610 family)